MSEVLRPPTTTFFGAPPCDDVSKLSADVGLFGVPSDSGVLPGIRTGAAWGPAAVRDAPTYYYFGKPYFVGEREGAVGWFDVEEEREHLVGVTMADCGDVSIEAGGIEPNLHRITDAARAVAARGALVAAVGGDHSISYPVGRGMESYGSVDIVHFDAHPDFADEAAGSRYTHGSNLRRLSELPFVRSITAIGLRNVTKLHFDEMSDRGVQIITAKKLIDEGPAAVHRALSPADHLYVSVDTDVLDASLVPGTTLPEPGGVPYRLLRDALGVTARRGRIVGFDLVELSAPNDATGVSARVTSWLLTHFLSAIFDARA